MGKFAEELKKYFDTTSKEILDDDWNQIKHLNDVGLMFYELDTDLIDHTTDGRTYVVRKQPQYPKTCEECCKVLGYNQMMPKDHILGYRGTLLSIFQLLLICRDAYWEIAGDWKPNLDSKQHKFAISNVGNKISFEVYGEYNSMLCFPTEEMRDAFYENFKDLIEQCKELL